MLLVLLESISVSKENPHVSGMTLMISVLVHRGSYQLTCVGEFLPAQMMSILLLPALSSEIKFPETVWQL